MLMMLIVGANDTAYLKTTDPDVIMMTLITDAMAANSDAASLVLVFLMMHLILVLMAVKFLLMTLMLKALLMLLRLKLLIIMSCSSKDVNEAEFDLKLLK